MCPFNCAVKSTVTSLHGAINLGIGAAVPLIASNLDTVTQVLPFLQMLLPGDVYAYAFAGLSIANILLGLRTNLKKPVSPDPTQGG